MSQILIEETVTQIGKKYSGLPSVKTFIKKCDSLIHCYLRKGSLLKFNIYKVARMLQIKRVKFITKCSLRDPGAKREPEEVITIRGKLKLKNLNQTEIYSHLKKRLQKRRKGGSYISGVPFPFFHPPPPR